MILTFPDPDPDPETPTLTKVIAAHCASEGEAQEDTGAWRPCQELLFEMMACDEWRGLLFADISARSISHSNPHPNPNSNPSLSPTPDHCPWP
jgi:hypothetical protein